MSTIGESPTLRALSPDALESELREIRRDLLPVFMMLLVLIPLVWLIYAARRVWSGLGMYLVDLGVVVIALSLIPILVLRSRHHNIACGVFLGALILAEGLLVMAYPAPIPMAFGVLVVVMAQGLFHGVASLPVVLVTWLVMAGAWGISRRQGILSSDTAWMLFLYGLAWLVSWLAVRPLHVSIVHSIMDWEQAHQMMVAARERRAELARALRALDEATYRIERMNSELLIARQEAEQARAVKARFVAMVSHELRGPLNLILGFSRLMAMSPEKYREPLPSSYRADVVTIYNNSQHLASLVDDILDLSQVEAQSMPLIKERVNLETEVVEEAIRIIEPLAERKGLFIHKELAGDLPPILADQVRLRQVMLNLLTNAVRFTERGGVTVRTARENSALLVTVEDTGLGIPREKMARLFQEFFQAHLLQEEDSRGTGLGLAISKHLVELHAGRIWAESQLGVGTRIYFSLPLPDADMDASAPIRTRQRMDHTPQERFVLVNADLDLIRPLSRYLQGYRVVGVNDQQEIMPLVEDLHPRAVITSPEVDEWVCAELTAKGLHVPVISWVLPWGLRHAGQQGVRSYLVKPVAPEAVLSIMRQVERQDRETTVLLVDDDPDAVRLLEVMLMALPRFYTILKAYDGARALEIMRNTVPDVVFMDLVMPGMDGEQTLAHMRADERLRQVPVVVISARDISEGVMTLETPISLRYGKPIDISRAANILQTVLDQLVADYLPPATVESVSSAAV